MFKRLIKWLYKRFVSDVTPEEVTAKNNKTEREEENNHLEKIDIQPKVKKIEHKIDDEQQYSDVLEVEIDGEKWWRVNGFWRNRPEDRKLKVGDAIVYHERGGYNENTVMIIKSFDFSSDIAARALIGVSPHHMSDGTTKFTYFSNFVPSYFEYRIAKREEVKEFLEKYKENDPDFYKMHFEQAKSFNNPLYNDLL